ncbi:MAG: hypothetical protein JRJ60_14070 [Deltaproteobacteria bacterium]|nr:hypothetical protein [Deltaproteobacteria bacterium]
MRLPNEFVLLIQVLSEDKKLRAWVESLDQLPINLRHAELKKMVLKMREEGEDETVISLVESLNKKPLLDAIVQALKDV